jgi:aspartate kinase
MNSNLLIGIFIGLRENKLWRKAKMIVMKFGGTSLGNAERIRKTAEIIKSGLEKKPVVVLSAIAKMTDALIRLANEAVNGAGEGTFNAIKNAHLEIIKELSIDESLLNNDFNELSKLVKVSQKNKKIDAKILDSFQSFGERMSSKIVAAHLNNIGIAAQPFNSWDLGLLTNDDFGNAEPLAPSYQNIKANLSKLNLVPVITGFIGKNENNEITTLGRGGSDFTAAIIGSSIDAKEIQIWTDVDGLMSTDPKIVANARIIPRVSFAEASELAYFGARVLHPKTILPAMKKKIPVKVLNSMNPKGEGTIILSESYKNNYPIKAIACKKGINLINIDSSRMLGAYGFLARIFYIFDKYRKSVDVISTSEVSVSLTIDNDENINNIIKELEKFSDVELSKDKSIICVVGDGLRQEKGNAGRIFTTLGKNDINIEMISQGASKINITFVVEGKNGEKAVKALHHEYFGG